MLSEILERRIRRQIGSLVGGLSSKQLCYSPRGARHGSSEEDEEDEDEADPEEEGAAGDACINDARHQLARPPLPPRGIDLELSFTETGRCLKDNEELYHHALRRHTHTHTPPPSLSLPLSLSPSPSPSLSVSMSLSFSLSVYLSLSHSLSLPPPPSPSLSLARFPNFPF